MKMNKLMWVFVLGVTVSIAGCGDLSPVKLKVMDDDGGRIIKRLRRLN